MVSRVETSVDEWTWSAQVAYACACGAYGSVTRWRWVDAEARPELAKRLREAGPLEGSCRSCQRPAEGGGAWLELSPAQEQATLVLGSLTSTTASITATSPRYDATRRTPSSG